MPITPLEAQMLIARCEQAKSKSQAMATAEKSLAMKLGIAPDPGPEGDLHDKILAECRRRGWLGFHGSMAHKTRRVRGEPDWIILADCGRLILIECKSKTGKLSKDQLCVIAHARKLGHRVDVVRSFREFLALCNSYPTL